MNIEEKVGWSVYWLGVAFVALTFSLALLERQ